VGTGVEAPRGHGAAGTGEAEAAFSTPVAIGATRPRTTKSFTEQEFADLTRTAALRARTRRRVEADPTYATPLPHEVSFQLTYKCNLRCSHCYQWSEQGFFRDLSAVRRRTELDVAIVDDVLRATAPVRAKVFLWGGEPLVHSRFGEIAALLAADPRTVTMCTNGLLLERNLDHLLALDDLNLLVSVDGLEADHDALRGRGTFARTVGNLSTMLDLQRRGVFRGEVSLSCMISNETVGHLVEIMEWAEGLGVNSVYFQLPWYISPAVAGRMDDLYARSFAWLNPPAPGERPSWHAYTYRLHPEHIGALRRSMQRLSERTWRSRVRFQPDLAPDEVEDFILGTSRPAAGRSRCLAVSNRMEVHADGRVSSCKFFPEFVVGDLHDAGALDLWRGERFRHVRQVLQGSGLMPVCSKCILLYLNGA
jgi:radical SAM protein with 4Fe4S-binding SPASM domain